MSQSRNQTVTNLPDAATQRYAEEVRRRALGVYGVASDINSNVMPGEQRVAGLSPLERQGMGLAGFVGGQVPGQWMGAQGMVDRGLAGQGVLGAVAGAVPGALAQQQALAAQAFPALAQMQQTGAGGLGAQDAIRQYAAAGLPGVAAMGGLAGTLPGAVGLLGQQAQQGADVNTMLAGGLGQGAGLFSSLAGLTPGAVAQQQAAVGGLVNPGLAAQSGALAGPNVAGFFNPFQNQVIDATRQQFDSARNRLNADISARATAAGAFGGGREAVVRGQALADLARDESQQVAGMLNAGFTDAMTRAMQDQQFRFGAGQAMTGQGLGLLDSIAGRGMAAGGQLFGGGMAAQQQGANALGQLFAGGQNAAQFGAGQGMQGAQFLAGLGAQNANALANLGTNAAQFTAGQGMQGASTLAGLGANAQSQLLANSLNGIGLLGQFGGLDRGIQQAVLDQQRAARDEPLNRLLSAYQALGMGFGGQGSIQTIPQTRNLAAGFLGGAATGASIGSFGGPIGSGIGAGVGGLLGLFG